MKSSLSNVSQVVVGDLCTGCGTCAAVCPVNAISIRLSNGVFLPNVNKAKCTSCSLCVDRCPASVLDFEKLNTEVFGKQPEDLFLGNYLRCYVGNSCDEEINANSSSGGVVTGLLAYALEKGLIDGAMVVRMRNDYPLLSEPFIANSKEDIVSAAKSKYCPVAADSGLKEILSKQGKFAVVGLPCHMHGIRKAEASSKELRDKIMLHVGLFCSHTVNFEGTKFLLERFGIRKEEVSEISYRGCGWPGFMVVRLKNGSSVKIRFNKGWRAYWNVFSPFFFTPYYCMVCRDHFNEFSDVSIGDAWLPEFRAKKSGEAILISRTAFAEELLAEMRRKGVMSLRPITESKVKQSQTFSLNFKKDNFSTRLSFYRMLGKGTPKPARNLGAFSLVAFPSAFLSYVSLVLSSKKRFRSLLRYLPLPLFRVYFGFFNCAFLLSRHVIQ